MIEEIASAVKARVLWAVIPSRAALGLEGNHQLAEIVGWAAANVTEDVRVIVARYRGSVEGERNER